MYKLVEFLFTNIFLVCIVGFCIYLFVSYNKLQDKKKNMQNQFDKALNVYLSNKINTANQIATKIINEYGREDAIRTEVIRLQVIIAKGIEGTISDKVVTCNVINKYQVSKDIDTERYPYFKELANIKTFHDIEIDSFTDDIAIARREYNRLAIEYNELSSSWIIQKLITVLGLELQFPVFENIYQEKYSDKYEVFEMQEPEINKISSLNKEETQEINNISEIPEGSPSLNPTPEIKIEHTDDTFKPTINL